MNLWILKPGHKIRLRNGAVARVLNETKDGTSIEVEYLESEVDAPLAGAQDLVKEHEVEVLLGVAHPRTWEDEITLMLHYSPESEDSEAYFEAVTMKGVPYGVSITGSSPDNAEAALNQLLDGLEAFGFAGHVIVEDATSVGRPERYDLWTS